MGAPEKLDPEKARRLARVLCSDLALFYPEAVAQMVRTGAVEAELAEAIDDARALYLRRGGDPALFEERLGLLRLTGEVATD